MTEEQQKTYERFIDKHLRYAVVGASANRKKYGNIVFRDLLSANFLVVPIHPKETTVEGKPCFSTLTAVKNGVDVAVVVVPPAVGLSVLDDAKAAGVTKVWFQPGAESAAIRKRAAALGLDIQDDGSCVMVARRFLGIGGPH